MAPTMNEEVVVTVKVPTDALAEDIRARHGIKADLQEMTLEDGVLVLSFRSGNGGSSKPNGSSGDAPKGDSDGGSNSNAKDSADGEEVETDANWEEEARSAWTR